MRNRLPSLLTAARFPLALGLLAAEVSTRFLALYLLCCLTDVLDGLAARRLNACSAFGARLDSAADLAVTAVLVWRLCPCQAPDPWLTLWICVAAAVRLAAALAARLRFGRFGFLHTWGNKCTGVLLALYPFALVLTGSPLDVGHRPHRGQLSSLEELVIECRAGTVGAGPARSVGKKIRSGSFMDRQAVLEWVQRQ